MKVKNNFKKLGDNQYSWTIWIEGTKEELDQIEYVSYFLHETFSIRRIVSTNVSEKFARTVMGWGEFLLKVEATMKSGRVKHAELWLDLGFKHTNIRKEKYKGEFK
jgi:transcription initiation factor IIF auxiliary subunit